MNPSSVADSYRRRLTPKQAEAQIYARATRALREALELDNPVALARAMADNRRLWDAVLGSVVDPANQLPISLRGQIASVARTILRECDAEAPDANLIIEINEHMAAALWT
ncbi:flagellar biosynthesis regulator FlaF [Roseococcus sp. YIM B11640]|uniref:flagellar biosynthesis regulator FlaF n=1 Tax=Roseococcus sp. YIM B11640 TaxID=3133973 RepID=UPI003C7C0C8C